MYTAVCRKVVRKSTTTPKSSVNSFKVFREIWKNVSLRKTHRGFDKFILFARLTFNSKSDEKWKKNGPISMNNRNNIKLNENKFWVTWAKNILKTIFYCSVPLIFTCMLAFVKIYQFQLKFIDHWILRLPLEIVTCTFSFFRQLFCKQPYMLILIYHCYSCHNHHCYY